MAKLSSTHIYGDLYVDGAIDGKVNKDSAGQQINTTYIKGLSVSGKTITYTKGDGTTGTITTQDTNTTYSAATQSAAGLMSAADKTKLDGIATGANKYTHPSYTAKSSGFYKVTVDASGHVSATTAVAKADITGLGIPAQDTTYSAATQSANGLMSAADKKKLDGIAASANNYSHPNSGVTASSYGPSANASPAHSGTFSVPYITVNAAGHITAASTKTITLPADNNTDTKVTNTLGTTTKFYLTGTTSSTTNTGTQYFDTGIYTSTTAGELVAGSIKLTSSYSGTTEYTSTPSGLTYIPVGDTANGAASTYSTILTVKESDNRQFQLNVDNGGSLLAFRSAHVNNTGGTGTGWSAWKKIYHEGNKPTPADIGAAAASHGTHLTIGTGASNAAAGNHTHSYLPLSGGTVTGNTTFNQYVKFNAWSGYGSGTADLWYDGTNKDLYVDNANDIKVGGNFVYHAGRKPSASDIGAAASSHTHTNIVFQDTRSANTTPDGAPEGLSVHLKNNGADGLSDGGTYHSSLFIKGWNDYSGGPYGNIAISANNNLWFRSSSSGTAWNAWKKASLDGHTHSYLPLSGGTMTGAIKSNSMASSWVSAANGNALINSTKGYGDFSPMLSGAATNGRMTLAFYNGAIMAGYLSKANCDAGNNTVSSTAQIFCENGGAVYNATIKTTYLTASNNMASTGGSIWSQNQYVGMTDANGAQFKAFFGMRSGRAACEVGDGSTAGQVTIRSGKGTAGSGVTILCEVSNGNNYVQYVSPEAGTIALTKHLSDRTRKENIKYVETDECGYSNKDFYNFIKDNLELATYNLKKEYAATDTHKKLNFIAQDILWDFDKQEENKVGNLIVQAQDAMEDQLSLSYDPETYTSVIAGALKEAISKIEELESERDSLRSEVNNLRTELDELKAIVKGLF